LLERLADGMIGDSNDAGRRFSRAARASGKFRAIWGGVDLHRFRPADDRTAARLALGLPSDRSILVFVGQVKREKGVLDLVDAVGLLGRELPPERVPLLLVIGTPGPPTIVEDIRRQAAASGVAGSVRVLPQQANIHEWLRAAHPLAPDFPEVALLGRSNVGKSSLLNELAGRRIAKVSGTPGKTRALNVYILGAGSRERGAGIAGDSRSLLPVPGSLYVLDLPGYGYSRASRADRAALRSLITHVLNRPLLAGVVWLLDIRRDPSDDDRAMQALFAARGTPVLAALTKSDTVARAARAGRARALREA